MKLLRRHFTLTAIFVVFFIWLGTITARTAFRIANEHDPRLPTLVARMIDRLDASDSVHGLKLLQETDPSFPYPMGILDEAGKFVSPSVDFPFQWNDISKPQAAYEMKNLVGRQREGTPYEGLIRLSGSPTRYLYISLSSRHRRPPPSLTWVTFGSQVASVLVAISFSFFLLFRALREKASLADTVLTQLQNGNLKARFPISRMDEVGQAMSRFNKMADEIERLVEHLRAVEKSRMALLQDLAHDLRTPVASLKNLLATLEKRDQPKDQAIRAELLGLAQKEVDYFARLLEDLLILAQISEPRYAANRHEIQVEEILEDEAESVATNYEAGGRKIELVKSLDQHAPVLGDPHLLRRMLRNALENAFSFAKGEVRIQTVRSANSIQIVLQDDGPGISDEALKGYGTRRISRAIGSTTEGRLSVGLGSVIMKTVAEIHGGSLKASRLPPSEGNGTRVEIRLPSVLN